VGGGAATTRFPNVILPLYVPSGTEFVRVHQKSHSPVFFGPASGASPQNRFDAPGGEYRVLYGARELPGAFVETVLRKPGRVMRRTVVNDRAWSRLQVLRPLRVAKLHDEGLHWHGVDGGDLSIDNYAPSRQLALDLYLAFSDLDGLSYRSRYDNGQICFALFNRVAVVELNRLHTQEFETVPAVVDQMMTLYGAAFDTSSPP
jgi:hypothetical protein